MSIRHLPLPLLLAAGSLWAQQPTPSSGVGEVGATVKRGRERLAGYQFRLRTELRVDDDTRLRKVENAHFAPSGELVLRIVKEERLPPPTPLPYGDPRRSTLDVSSPEEEERFAEQAQALMRHYARLSPDLLDEWAKKAELLPEDPDRPGLVRLHGRGLGRELDDALLFLDAKSRRAVEIEVKTTVDPAVVDIAFLRVTFELETIRADEPPLVVPRRVFLNMTRKRHRVTLEMETSDFRTWP